MWVEFGPQNEYALFYSSTCTCRSLAWPIPGPARPSGGPGGFRYQALSSRSRRRLTGMMHGRVQPQSGPGNPSGIMIDIPYPQSHPTGTLSQLSPGGFHQATMQEAAHYCHQTKACRVRRLQIPPLHHQVVGPLGHHLSQKARRLHPGRPVRKAQRFPYPVRGRLERAGRQSTGKLGRIAAKRVVHHQR